MRARTTLGVVALLTLWLPLGAAAQDGPSVAMRGSRSIGAGALGTTLVGFWVKAGEGTDVGLDASLALDDNDTDRLWSISLRPTLKRYWSADSAVSPYLTVGLEASWTKREIDGVTEDATTRLLGGFLGIGIDWFPAQRVSVGADVGVRGGLTRDRAAAPLSGSEERTGFRIQTAASGIRVHLYF